MNLKSLRSSEFGVTIFIFWAGNETFERLASIGLMANFMVYLTTKLHMDQVSASNVMNIWNGFTNFAPLFGAFVSDAYAGRFWTIAFASFASLLVCSFCPLIIFYSCLHISIYIVNVTYLLVTPS